ncbi:hypothetical protein NZD89_27920 (plasmid) [Alicyclobacillus fastidiosus]|uniref:Uncharacterized protein n=1 Tax=Alicyclobacillus fastidiosus TaxID=392011 RepID=A0ABY6ZPW5_9BACL|nr:hypothetical protein [Alicyclobacillus fastidiosus]WAH44877.1 hypothetical protein NZD89_27920 [Alicyclobacillus fastidiosus]GMA65633.1 hypothetical protein GCM10025859_60730 [Alicyclobacillus fastidiosus]GMA65851.1 hypothetical protein GCM10025859_62910 [Alicyclobacillus fastidiosus]
MSTATLDKSVTCQFLLKTIVEMAREVQSLQERHILPRDMSSVELTAFISACASVFNEKYGEQYRQSQNKYLDGYYHAVDYFLLKCIKEQYPEEMEQARLAAPVAIIRWHREDIEVALKQRSIEATPENVERFVRSTAMKTLEERSVAEGWVIIDDCLPDVFEA